MIDLNEFGYVDEFKKEVVFTHSPITGKRIVEKHFDGADFMYPRRSSQVSNLNKNVIYPLQAKVRELEAEIAKLKRPIDRTRKAKGMLSQEKKIVKALEEQVELLEKKRELEGG